jgi:hypothetical protein
VSGWTKGPWRVFHQSGVLSVMAGETTREVVHWSGFDSSHFPNQAVANAHLISQAPALYDALRSFCISVSPYTDLKPDPEVYAEIQREYGGGIAEAWRQARAALAAAGGEA